MNCQNQHIDVIKEYQKPKNSFFLNKWSKKIFSICILLIFIMILVIGAKSSTLSQPAKEKDLDYSLVYDKDYYITYNPDIAEVYGNEDEKLFEHFLQNGMHEGRRASEYFDVYYYQKHNADLYELYGDELELYYLHYMEYGYSEGRNGSDVFKTDYVGELNTVLKDDQNILCSFSTLDYTAKKEGEKFYLFEIPAYATDLSEYSPVEEFIAEDELEFIIPLHSITNKFVIAKKQQNEYISVTNMSYIENPEILAQNNCLPPKVNSKKGLQVKNTMQDDMDDLYLSYTFRNLIIENIMSPNNTDDVISYEYKDHTYYFKKEIIEELDNAISRETKNGVKVIASVISIKAPGFEDLYYPGIDMNTDASFYALNTTTKEGLAYVEAFVTFMSKRYNGATPDHGMICSWIVGNEVNESATYNYMGPYELSSYMEEYTRTFRVIYNIVKSNIPNANVYVPMEPWWGIDSNMFTYGGKDFLDTFNARMSLEGNIDWGLAYHAYSYPLSDPKVLNDDVRTIDETGTLTLDKYFTTDSLDTVTITMKNIDVLTDYMHEPQFLTSDNQVRSIILSEQGYTANSNVYGSCEAQQAASLVYAYYKAEMNKDIDAFIYFLQLDTESSSLGNSYYQFGLSTPTNDGNIHSRLSHDVFKVMDTNESIERLSYFKQILGINDWEDEIPNFNKNTFDYFQKLPEEDSQKLDNKIPITDAVVKDIAPQTFTGEECLPNIVVMLNGKPLLNDVDYDIVYLNNTEIGTGTALIVGIGNYKGILTASFTINK